MVFDVIFVIYLAANGFLGYRYGVFRRLVHLGFFFLGMLLSQALSPGFAEQFGYQNGPHPADAHFGVYLALLLGLVIVAEVLAFAYADALSFMNAMLFDRFLGGVLGIAASVLEVAVLIYLFAQLTAVALPSGGSHSAIVNSTQEQLSVSLLAKQIRRVQVPALFFFRPVLPPEPATYFAKTYS
ncbi:MAG: hypothetical protein NVSMB17_14770 [Candidatus Dormibacteria bacterium]